MKVEVITTKGEYDNDTSLKIHVNEKRRFRIGEGEPEDMVLWRDLSDAYEVADLMREAYEAGKNGEDFVLTYHENED